MTHARESRLPDWIALLSQPPPGPFDSSVLTWDKQLAGRRGQQQHETSIAVILADRLQDFIDGAPRRPLRKSNFSTWWCSTLRTCLQVWAEANWGMKARCL